MRLRPPALARWAEDVACGVVGGDLGAVMTDPRRQLDGRTAGIERTPKVVEVSMGVRNHAKVGHLDSAQTMGTGQHPAPTESFVSATHAAPGFIDIARTTWVPPHERRGFGVPVGKA